MGKVSQLVYDIETLYIDGMTAKTIALTLDVPVETVLGVLEQMCVEDAPYDEYDYA